MPVTGKTTASQTLRRLKKSYGKVKITKQFHKDVARLWRDSAKELVIAAAERIPVDTGMSRSSLVPLARLLRVKGEVAASGPSKVGVFDIEGNYDRGGDRSAAAGEAAGANAFEYSIGSPKRFVMSVSFDISVWQHLWLENRGLGSISVGEAAARTYFNANFDAYVKKRVDRGQFSDG